MNKTKRLLVIYSDYSFLLITFFTADNPPPHPHPTFLTSQPLPPPLRKMQTKQWSVSLQLCKSWLLLKRRNGEWMCLDFSINHLSCFLLKLWMISYFDEYFSDIQCIQKVFTLAHFVMLQPYTKIISFISLIKLHKIPRRKRKICLKCFAFHFAIHWYGKSEISHW